MARNTVTLTFAGDAENLEKTFTQVGSSATTMGNKVDRASKDVGGGFDRVGAAADGATTHFRGTADVVDGLGTVLGNTALGPVAGMAMGFADIADGLGTTFLPMLKNVITRLAATSVGVWAVNAATTAWTVAQGALTVVLSLNPIALVVIALAALVAGFVLAWKHSETFHDVVRGALDTVKDAAGDLWNFFKDLPGMLLGIADKIKDAILWPYKTAFNMIAKLWNQTVGRLSFEVPSWVPGMGGKGFAMPQLPTFHSGGVVPGTPGQAVPILAMAGETVIPAGRGGGGGVVHVHVSLDGRDIHQSLLRLQRTSGNLGIVGA